MQMIYSDSTTTLNTKDITLFDLQDNFKKLYTGRIYTDNEDLKYIFSNTKSLSESSLPDSLITTIKNICKKNTISGYVILTQKDKALYPVDGACLSYNLMTIFSELEKKLGLEKAKELFSSIKLSCIRINDANDVQQLKQEAEECEKDWKETELRLAEYDRIIKEGDRLEIEAKKRREELNKLTKTTSNKLSSDSVSLDTNW